MRRAVVTLTVVLLCATAHAEKRRQTAQILSSVGAGVSGAVVIAGFVSAPDAKRINEPVMYTGIGLLFVTPSLGQFYAEQYLTIGMGVRALAAGFAIYTLETQTRLATCDTAMSSTEPPCEIFKESAYPLARHRRDRLHRRRLVRRARRGRRGRSLEPQARPVGHARRAHRARARAGAHAQRRLLRIARARRQRCASVSTATSRPSAASASPRARPA